MGPLTRAVALWLGMMGAACGDGALDAFSRSTRDAGGAGPADAQPPEAAGSGPFDAGTRRLLVDDFEDGDSRCALGGWWYPVSDQTAVQAFDIQETPRGGSRYAGYTAGEGFEVWGAAIGVDLAFMRQALDARGYSELRFWAKAGPESTQSLSVHVLQETGAKHFTAPVVLTTEWQEFTLALYDLESGGEGGAPLDISQLVALQMFSPVNQPFEYWIDDVFLVAP